MKSSDTKVLRFGGFQILTAKKCLLSADGQEVRLRLKCYQVLDYLSRHADTVVSREDLLNAVWGNIVVNDDSLTRCISEVRTALNDDCKEILVTIPKLGYQLKSDPVAAVNESAESAHSMLSPRGQDNISVQRTPQNKILASLSNPLKLGIMTAVALLGLMLLLSLGGESKYDNPEVADSNVANSAPQVVQTDSEPVENKGFDRPAVSIGVRSTEGVQSSAFDPLYPLAQELRLALSRYRLVQVVENKASSDFNVVLATLPGDSDVLRVSVELQTSGGRLLAADPLDIPPDTTDFRQYGGAAAGLIASPAGGSLANELLKRAESKPVEAIGRAECYVFAYACSSCRGSMDTVTPKALACLEKFLDNDPYDAQAWSMLASVKMHQWEFGSALPEPQRSHLQSREYLREAATDAAQRAFELDPNDPAVFHGLAKAYLAACEPNALQQAVRQGVRLNPDDAAALAMFGNWLAYSGHWDEGTALASRAIELIPHRYESWWLWASAKHAYAMGQYEEALEGFLEAFQETNWISHLQLAYAYSSLGDMGKAQKALERLQHYQPGMTLERALQFYQSYCFSDAFRERIREALVRIDMPSRGIIHDIDHIETPKVQLIKAADHEVELIDIGDGEPIVFVHGEISDYRAWGYQRLPFSENHRYIAYSRSYYGSQQKPDDGSGYEIAHYADELIGVIESLGLGAVHVVSWSSSGQIANQAVHQRPDLFLTNIMYEPVFNDYKDATFNASLDLREQRAREERLELFSQVAKHAQAEEHELALKSMLNTVFQKPHSALEQEIPPNRRMFLDNAETVALYFRSLMAGTTGTTMDCDALGNIQVPSLVMYGENTNLYRQAGFRYIAECLGDAQTAVIAGVNHDAPIRSPAVFNALLKEFIEKHGVN